VAIGPIYCGCSKFFKDTNYTFSKEPRFHFKFQFLEDTKDKEIVPNFLIHTKALNILIPFSSEAWNLKMEMWPLRQTPIGHRYTRLCLNYPIR